MSGFEDYGFVIWLAGLPGSGKTTIAKGLKKQLEVRGLKVEVFDGNEVRKNLSKGLGFSKEDRDTHNKKVIYVCKLLTRNRGQRHCLLDLSLPKHQSLRQGTTPKIRGGVPEMFPRRMHTPRSKRIIQEGFSR